MVVTMPAVGAAVGLAACLARRRAPAGAGAPGRSARWRRARSTRRGVPPRDARRRLPGAVDDAGRGRGARPRAGGGRAHRGATGGRPADPRPRARRPRTGAATPSAASTRTRRTSSPRSCTTRSSTQLVRDQMSAQHPAGALVTDEIARAAGVPTVPIRLVVLPDDPALGEHRETFAGLVGTFAEYPTAATPPARASSAPPRSSATRRCTPGSPRAPTTAWPCGAPAGAAPRPARLRLRPAPQAVALGEAAGRRALAPDPGGPRPGLRALRGAARAHCRRLRPAAAAVSGRGTTGSPASPSTAASRTAGCCRSSRARIGARRRRT
jgi:hypothetical protein